LADLNARLMDARPTQDFSFWWALVMPDPDSGKLLQTVGWIDARHSGIVKYSGKALRQFDLALRSDPSVNGHLQLDPETGAIVAADFDRPNHDNYRDFKLGLERIEPGGQAAWERLLASHYAGCE